MQQKRLHDKVQSTLYSLIECLTSGYREAQQKHLQDKMQAVYLAAVACQLASRARVITCGVGLLIHCREQQKRLQDKMQSSK